MQPLCLCVRVCMGAHVCVCVCERERERESKPFCFHPCQPCYQPISCSHYQKHAVQCCGSNSECLNKENELIIKNGRMEKIHQ